MNHNNDPQNPLFIHPSDGPSTITLGEKLTGTSNYRAWRRSMEISLSTKRKLVFVHGTIAKATDDPQKADQWEACNNMVIAWLVNNVSDSIARSILYVKSAAEIWSQLEKRFAFANGSRKYHLNKQTYSLRQEGHSVSDYYTKLKGVWEELESMSDLPCITTNAADVTQFLACFHKQMAEHRLFQFLNGLDDVYQAQRSQILLMTPLPSVELVCGMLQQEEQQRQVLEGIPISSESSALLSKNLEVRMDARCSVCGNKGHTADKCWHIVGFPSWHPRSNRQSQGQRRAGRAGRSFPQGGRTFRPRNETWKGAAAQVEVDQSAYSQNQSPALTAQQVEQLLKLLPQASTSHSNSAPKFSSETDEELDLNFAGLCKLSSQRHW
uniref:Uncharacterized protein n=1 Tax=Opuntia streptacantha TaxID=393608 RepID=A0A7C9ANZ1_OPUST